MASAFVDSFRDVEFLRSAPRAQGVHPDDLAALLSYVPQALTELTWRNTVLEGWRGGPVSRISDAEIDALKCCDDLREPQPEQKTSTSPASVG